MVVSHPSVPYMVHKTVEGFAKHGVSYSVTGDTPYELIKRAYDMVSTFEREVDEQTFLRQYMGMPPSTINAAPVCKPSGAENLNQSSAVVTSTTSSNSKYTTTNGNRSVTNDNNRNKSHREEDSVSSESRLSSGGLKELFSSKLFRKSSKRPTNAKSPGSKRPTKKMKTKDAGGASANTTSVHSPSTPSTPVNDVQTPQNHQQDQGGVYDVVAPKFDQTGRPAGSTTLASGLTSHLADKAVESLKKTTKPAKSPHAWLSPVFDKDGKVIGSTVREQNEVPSPTVHGANDNGFSGPPPKKDRERAVPPRKNLQNFVSRPSNAAGAHLSQQQKGEDGSWSLKTNSDHEAAGPDTNKKE